MNHVLGLFSPPALRLSVSLAAMLFVLAGPREARAQRTTASVAGSILDASQAAVPDATVVVRNEATGVERTARSNELGYYVVTALPAGPYSITVSKPGFQSRTVSNLILQVDQNATVNLELQVGAVAESVEVTAEAVAVDTRTATLNTVVNQRQITDLPLNGRNVLQLTRLTPGTLIGTGTFSQAATRPEAGSQMVSASGGRGNSTAYILDGGVHEDPYTEVANVVPNPDAIQEFSFQTNNYSAKFGGRGGGVVNMVTRSGTNEFHGALFEYIRNHKLNARNFFALTDDGLKRNQYGVSIGGPVVRNQTFFFFSWQGTQIRQRPGTSTAVVPTAAQRAGDFSAIPRQLVDARRSPARLPAPSLGPLLLRRTRQPRGHRPLQPPDGHPGPAVAESERQLLAHVHGQPDVTQQHDAQLQPRLEYSDRPRFSRKPGGRHERAHSLERGHASRQRQRLLRV